MIEAAVRCRHTHQCSRARAPCNMAGASLTSGELDARHFCLQKLS